MKSKQKFLLSIVICFLSVVYLASAKRSVPIIAPPICDSGVEYSTSIEDEGFVIASWKKNGRRMWKRQVYVIKHEYKLGLDPDVQTCHITEMTLTNGVLVVQNEKKSKFTVDIESLEVKVLHGSMVIDYTEGAVKILGSVP